jgi:hypothetical protein
VRPSRSKRSMPYASGSVLKSQYCKIGGPFRAGSGLLEKHFHEPVHVTISYETYAFLGIVTAGIHSVL